MSKYCGPRLRIIRRLGDLATLSQKKTKRKAQPGQSGLVRKKPTQFALRLVEKQKLRFYYGISEKQLTRYVRYARNAKGSTNQILLKKLEIRLDTIVYRLNWTPTMPYARQLVNHGHIFVNRNRSNIPSFSCKSGCIIRVCAKPKIRISVKHNEQILKKKNSVAFVFGCRKFDSSSNT